MTISFSGPASGIDTTAWVDALVKMKQASVTSLENKKQTLEATTSILDNVKSFFASFKSVITNVTQANLGIASFDLFVQNLVESTNAEVATASVTTEAQQDNYELFVDQLATETQAESVFFTNIISTTENIATHNSLLSSIGIGTGNVGFNVGGVERVITLQSNDTIGSLLDKLNKIGVDASYDAQFGHFSINLDLDDINDDLDGDGINNTGIKEAFFLEDVNSGYASDTLELSYLETFVIKATEAATMRAFGITDGNFKVTDQNGNVTELCANVDGTFREFFDMLEGYGLHASFTENGEVHIDTTDGYLISGTLAEQLGIVIDDQSEKTDTKASSTLGVFSTEVLNAEYTSTLEEIGAMVTGNEKLQVLDENRNLIAEISSLTKSSTIDDLFNALAPYGIEGFLNNNVVSLDSANGYIIGGEIAENLGVNTVYTSTTTLIAGQSTTSTSMVSYVASATDWVSDCLWDVWDSYSAADKVLTVTHTDRYGTDQTYYYTVVAKNSIASDGSVLKGTQFQEIADWYHSIDPTSTFVFNDNGQIFIDSNDCFTFSGKIADYLGIGSHTETYTWTEGITTTTSTATISYRVRKTDYISDTLWDNGWLNYSDGDKVIKAYSLTVDHTASINSVSHPDFGGTNVAEGDYIETNATYQHTVQTLVGTFTIKQGETTYEDFGYWYTHNIDTTAIFSVNNDGTLSIDSDNTFHLEGRVISDLGLGISTVSQSWTTGLEETQSTGSVTYAAKMTDYISDTFTSDQWNGVNKVISVYSSNVDHINGGDGNSVYQVTIQTKLTDITITTSTTFNNLRDSLAAYNITLTMNNGVVTLDSSKSNYLVEDVFQDITYANGITILQSRTSSTDGTTSMLQHFGITYDTVTNYWTTGNEMTKSTAAISYLADNDDYISNMFTSGTWNGMGKTYKIMQSVINYSTGNKEENVIYEGTISDTTSFEDFKNTVTQKSGNRISLNLVNGVMSISASENLYIAGDVPSAIGIITQTRNATYTYAASASSSGALTYNEITTADRISDIVGWENISDKNIYVVNQYYNRDTHSMVYQTVKTINTTNMTVAELNNQTSGYGVNISANGSAVTQYNTNGYYYINGAMVNFLGLNESGTTRTATVGKSYTGSQLTATAQSDSKMTDFGISSGTTVSVKKWNALSMSSTTERSVQVGSKTFQEFINALNGTGVSGSFSNGTMSFSLSSGRYLEGGFGWSGFNSYGYTVYTSSSVYTNSLSYNTVTVTGSQTVITEDTYKSKGTFQGSWLSRDVMQGKYVSFCTGVDKEHTSNDSGDHDFTIMDADLDEAITRGEKVLCDRKGVKMVLKGDGSGGDGTAAQQRYRIEVYVSNGYIIDSCYNFALVGLSGWWGDYTTKDPKYITESTLTTTPITRSFSSSCADMRLKDLIQMPSDFICLRLRKWSDNGAGGLNYTDVDMRVNTESSVNGLNNYYNTHPYDFAGTDCNIRATIEGDKIKFYSVNSGADRFQIIDWYYDSHDAVFNKGSLSRSSSNKTCYSDTSRSSGKYTKTADGATRLKELGSTSSGSLFNVTSYSSNVEGSGSVSTGGVASVDGNTTLSSIINALNNAGLGASLSGGRITIASSGRNYISSVSNTGALSALGLSTSASSYYQNVNWTQYYNKTTGTTRAQYITDHNKTRATLGKMGYGQQTFVSSQHTAGYEPTTVSNTNIVWATGTSINDFMQQLRNAGYTVTLNSSAHTVSVTSNSGYSYNLSSTGGNNPLQLSTSYGTKTIGFTNINNSNAERRTYLNGRTRLGDMTINSAQTIDIVFHKNNTFAQNQTDGLNSATGVTQTVTVTWSQGEQLQTFINRINNTINSKRSSWGYDYALNVTVNEADRTLELTGNEYTYVSNISSELASYVKVNTKENSTYGKSYSYNMIYRADADRNTNGTNPTAIDYTYLNGRNTTLNNLSYVDASGHTISTTQSQTMDIVIHINNTYAQDNTKSGIEQKVISSGETIYITTTSGTTQTSATEITYNSVVIAKTSSTFAELGINTSSPIAVYDGSQNKLGEFTMSSTSTIHDFLVELNNINENANASINSNGVITIEEGYITGSVAAALGLNMKFYGANTVALTQTSASEITYSQTVNISDSTTLAEIGFNTAGKTEVFDMYGTKKGEFTLSTSATVGDFINGINEKAGSTVATLNNGCITIETGYVTGALAEQFGLLAQESADRSVVSATTTGYAGLFYTTTSNATAATTFSELNIDTNSQISLYDINNELVRVFSMADYMTGGEEPTLQNLVNAINSYTYEGNASITNDDITIRSGFITGDVATALGFETKTATVTTTVGSTAVSATPITYYTYVEAEASATFGGLNIDTTEAVNVYNANGSSAGTFYMAQGNTLADFCAAINAVTFENNAQINGNVITIQNGYVTGSVAEALSLGTEDVYTPTLQGIQIASSIAITYTENGETILANRATTLADLGLNARSAIRVKDIATGAEESFSIEYQDKYKNGTLIQHKTTVGEVLDFLNTHGVSASIQNGIITIGNETDAAYVSSLSAKVEKALNIKDMVGLHKSYDTVTVHTTETTGGTVNTSVTEHFVNEDTTFRDLGLDIDNYFIRTNNGDVYINRDDKVMATFRNTEIGLGFGISVDENGYVTISGTDELYIKTDKNGFLANNMHITPGLDSTYQKTSHKEYSANANNIKYDIVHTLEAGTTFGDIKFNTSSEFYVTNRLTGATKTVSFTKTSNIIDTFKNAVSDGVGFSISVGTNGELTITPDDDTYYISSVKNHTTGNVAQALNINVGEGYTWNYAGYDKFESSTSNQITTEIYKTLDANTTLGDFGLSNGNIVLSNNTTINIHAGDKIMSKLAVLRNNGFNVTLDNGIITIESTGSNFVKSISSGLANILNMSSGEGETYQTNHPYGSTNSKNLKATELRSIGEETTIANLLGANGSATFTTNTGTYTVTASQTVMNALRSAGLGVSEVNGKLSITGNGSIYLTGMSDNLRNALKLEVGEGKTWNKYVDEVISDGNISAVTRTITVTWTYGALGTEDYQAKPETLNQFLADVNASLAQATTTYKNMFNLSEDYTVSAYVDGEGKLHFTGDEYTYVSRVDDFLANALKIKSVTKEGTSYGKSYSYEVQYANNSNNQTQYTYTNYDNMRLQNFDTYTDQYITIVTHNNTTFVTDATDDRIIKNGTVLENNTTTTYVITWTAGSTGHTKVGNGYNNNDNAVRDGETFEELKYELEHFGVLNALATDASAVLGNDIYKINVTINADKTISLVGNEYTYILGISDDLKKDFKIENRAGNGYYYSTYDYNLTYNNDGYTKQNTTLLNYDTRLDNLSIMADMTMTLETPEGGKSILFDHDTTIQEMKERLFSDYGIEVTIEDKTGRITFTPTLIDEGYYIVGMDTELKDKLKVITGEKGTYTLDSEQIIATNQAGVYTTTTYHNATTTGGTYETSTKDNYDNTASRNLRFEDDNNVIKTSTRISRLNGYDNGNGNITVHYADGLEQNISIRESMTFGQLSNILQDYGVTTEVLAGGRVTFSSNDGTYLKNAEGGSNLLDVLNMSDFSVKIEGTTLIDSKTLEYKDVREATYFATEETLLSTYAEGLLEANGVITFSLNDKYKSVTITSDDTFGTLIEKFKEKGLNAKIEAGQFSISSGFDTFSIIQAATTSNLAAIIKLNEKLDLGGYAMTDKSRTVISTTTISDTKSLSVVNFADEHTTLDTFNIIGGTLSIYVDGRKAGVQVSGNDTIKTLQDKLRTALGQDKNGPDGENITLKFEDGYLKIYQDNANLVVGSNEDTSNFVAITGIFSNYGGAESTRRFFKANENTKVTESGIFRNGDVTTGDFVIGDATITVDETTTLGELASKINTNTESNVTAYWDSIDGEMRIKSNSTGNFYINFEAGSSNFTDMLGFTKTSYDVEKGTTTTSINTDVQKQGKNARVRINGATYTSVSNTLGSDVTSIKGLTINLKGMSSGEATILSVKRDVQSLAMAISDVVDAYNALIDNINATLSSKSELKNDSELKRLRNQIKSIMTGTNKNSSIFKNVLSIGIVTNTADPTNLSVGSGIYKLSLDYEKFAKAFEADEIGVRTLLIGRVDDEGNVLEEGVLTKLEALIDEAVDSAGGYFERTEESFERQINRLDVKIEKGNDAIEKYRERLEKKYMSMNILNSNIQTQYQVYFN